MSLFVSSVIGTVGMSATMMESMYCAGCICVCTRDPVWNNGDVIGLVRI